VLVWCVCDNEIEGLHMVSKYEMRSFRKKRVQRATIPLKQIFKQGIVFFSPAAPIISKGTSAT
jgi:hypothetical protein